MRLIEKRLVIVFFCILLQGCLIAQLRGHVGGAAISVHALNEPGRLIYQGITQSPELIEETKFKSLFRELNATRQLFWVGTVDFGVAGVEPEQLYLATATGGNDYDSNLNLALDQEPRQVQGKWHAVVPGHSFALKTNRVSVLTEAAYQWLLTTEDTKLEERSNEEILAQLDAAAKQVLDDVNGDGKVSYADLLMWHPTINADKFRGSQKHLDQMYAVIYLGANDRLTSWAGHQLITGKTKKPDQQESLWRYLTD